MRHHHDATLYSECKPAHPLQKAMASREAEVKEKLMQIRQAEEKYKAKHGVYTGDFRHW